jgi:DNA topoisomerase VI subunit B
MEVEVPSINGQSEAPDTSPATRPVKGGSKLQRATFRTSRLLDFCSRKELMAQTGHEPSDWPLVVLKELMDNSLDACEEAGISPEIAVTVGPDHITIADNGPGIPAETVAGVLNFSVRVSSREAYVSPTRGAQGNALKTIIAMPFVLSEDAGQGRVTVTARDVRHEITLRVDRIRQQPVIDHQQHAEAGTRGTVVRVEWPDSPCQNSTPRRRVSYKWAPTSGPIHQGQKATTRRSGSYKSPATTRS